MHIGFHGRDPYIVQAVVPILVKDCIKHLRLVPYRPIKIWFLGFPPLRSQTGFVIVYNEDFSIPTEAFSVRLIALPRDCISIALHDTRQILVFILVVTLQLLQILRHYMKAY